MFTNLKMYVLDPKVYHEEDLDRDRLVLNQIDRQFLSHLIFIPHFDFDSFKCLDLQKVRENEYIIREELKKKKVEIILGFNPRHNQ